jgi:hypothetical protein
LAKCRIVQDITDGAGWDQIQADVFINPGLFTVFRRGRLNVLNL